MTNEPEVTIQTPSAEDKAVWDAFFAAASAAIETGMRFAEGQTPGLRAELMDAVKMGFRPRLVVQRVPLLTASLQLTGIGEDGEPAELDVFRFQAEDYPGGVN
jgi:hypothetical protein